MNIIVRLDISKKIGTGHFRRMLNLSKFMSKHKFYFIIKTDDKSSDIFKNINTYFIDDNEKDIIDEICNKENIDLIILDRLKYEKSYIKNIKSIVNKKVVSFHEYKDYSIYSDLKINYNFFDGFESNLDINFLSGPKYIIFNDEIAKYKNLKRDSFIFVSFGGSDPSGILNKFIENIAIKLKDIKFKIHIGNFSNLDIKIENYKNIELLYRPTNIFAYMASSKISVTAGGNMMYELIYLHTPSLVIAHNQHQKEFALNAERYGCVKYLGLANDIEFEKILVEVKNLYINPFNLSCKYNIDNEGKERIAQAIESIVS